MGHSMETCAVSYAFQELCILDFDWYDLYQTQKSEQNFNSEPLYLKLCVIYRIFSWIYPKANYFSANHRFF